MRILQHWPSIRPTLVQRLVPAERLLLYSFRQLFSLSVDQDVLVAWPAIWSRQSTHYLNVVHHAPCSYSMNLLAKSLSCSQLLPRCLKKRCCSKWAAVDPRQRIRRKIGGACKSDFFAIANFGSSIIVDCPYIK